MLKWLMTGLTLGAVALAAHCADAPPPAPAPLNPVVEAQEDIYEYTDPKNGAGPLWGYGNSCVARIGERVFVLGMETIPGQKPNNNVRWVLGERGASGWMQVGRDDTGRTREPCPLACFNDGRLFVSASPTLTTPDKDNGPSQPQVVEFDTTKPGESPQILTPPFQDEAQFTEHTYRGFAADGESHGLLDVRIKNYDGYYWSYMDSKGEWSAKGFIPFVMGQYETPEPDRACYPQVAIRGKFACIMAVSDIVEPVTVWKDFKFQKSGQQWDYVFRKLYFTWTPDITKTPFCEWKKLADVEELGGYILNYDSYVDKDGAVHLLWREENLKRDLRDEFFPGTPYMEAVRYMVVKNGEVTVDRNLMERYDTPAYATVSWARLHATPDGRLFIVDYMSGQDQGGNFALNRVAEILPNGDVGQPAPLDITEPFTRFDTNTTRLGSAPSNTVDIVGTGNARGTVMRYARVKLY